MFSWQNIPGVFGAAANTKFSNSNGACFSDEERFVYDQLLRPYKQSGLVKDVVYQDGGPIAFLLVKKKSSIGAGNLIFCVLKEQSFRQLPIYYLNFSGGDHHSGTLNFENVVQHTRLNMDRVYGTAPINHLSLV